MTVVFVAAMSVFNLLFIGHLNQSTAAVGKFFFRNDLSSNNPSAIGLAATQGGNPINTNFADESQETRFIIIDSTSLLNTGNPLSNVLPTRDNLLIYKVQKGDNLSRIAANFGISLNTILWANSNLKNNLLQPGQEIIILPVTGVLHQIQEDENLEIIANRYGVNTQKILSANPHLTPAKFSIGAMIVIPDSRPLISEQLASVSSLPSLPGYFSIPTTGWNWGRLHSYNAVDIANACGTFVYAAAEGLVVEESSSYSWNDGYGNYVTLEHPNGTKTRYAHTEKNLVSIGDYALKGDQIAIIGNTGLTHGPTGCHLHFEVHGARNPFAK